LATYHYPPMKLPHGIHDFQELVKKGFYYIDRTPYIEKLERSKDRLVLFRRPNGFDRKLFISMLGYYYGIQYRSKFETLFKRYYIGQKKTAQANQYYILAFDLCNLDLVNLQKTEQTLTHSVKKGIEAFLRQYKNIPNGKQNSTLVNDGFEKMLTTFLHSCAEYNIYLFLDDAQGLISDIADPGTRYSPFNLVTRSLITRFFRIIERGLSQGIIGRILSLGIDESHDRD